MSGIDPSISTSCLLTPELVEPFEPQAEDILTDEDLLDLFRIVKQVLRKNPDSEKLAKLLFCMSYALGDHIKFSKPCHEDRIVFRDAHSTVHSVRLPNTSSCCYKQTEKPEKDSAQKWIDSSNSVNSNTTPLSPILNTRLPSVSYLTNNSSTPLSDTSTTDPYSARSFANIKPIDPPASTLNHHAASPLFSGNSNSIPSPSSVTTQQPQQPQQPQQQMLEIADLTLTNTESSLLTDHLPKISQANNNIIQPKNGEIVMEPQQRGFYYQDGRIAREPVLLQRYAEQGILTQASLMKKRKRHSIDMNHSSPYEISNIPTPTKKPKIPHRHGEFESRRDDIINRLRIITMADLEQKAQRLPQQFTLAIDKSVTSNEEVLAATVANNGSLSQEQLGEFLEPALRILTNHSNMKPHLDNGMNQNGIYYNSDYFRLYLAFEQFQRTFAILFPNEVVKITSSETATQEDIDRDKDRERNANMKVYRPWIEPLLTETNWAAFRRNIVVGERMMQLTKSVGQGILLMTKELSGSKLHLTFTNSEWDEFINGLNSGKWDETIEWEPGQRRDFEKNSCALLVSELRLKFNTNFWFYPEGHLVSSKERRLLIHASTVGNNTNILVHRNSLMDSNLLQHNQPSHHHHHHHQQQR